MDLATLRRLASDGFGAVPADRLEDLAAWCDDWAVASGEARFSLIAETLRKILDGWGEQGIPLQLVGQVESCLRDYLTIAVDVEDARDGAYLAGRLREEIRQLPWSAAEWERKGWVTRSKTSPT